MSLLQTECVSYLVGSEAVSIRPFAPYDSILCEFLSSLSAELRTSSEAADYPDVLTFAFWCRKANIAKLKTGFDDGKSRLGVGLVFHVTPSNVPVNFAFSFVFGLLSGNANIVRVPTKPYPQTDIICAVINRLFEDEKFREIREMTAFVRYERDDEITEIFSTRSNARILWGGDEAIRNLRKFSTPERCVDITFPDRYSFCVIGTPAVIHLNETELNRLAEGFYNDTYLMDQNACSSPHLVVWQGEGREVAKERFWSAVERIAREKYELSGIAAVDKYTLLCRDAVELNTIRSFEKHGNHVYRVALESLPENMDAFRGQSGYFYEYDADDLVRLAPIVNTKYQTLTYFGVEKSRLLDFVMKNRLPGIDRIVPVGTALDIDVIWDGCDIVSSLSRIVDVK